MQYYGKEGVSGNCMSALPSFTLKTPLFEGEVWQYFRFYGRCCGSENIKAQAILIGIIYNASSAISPG
jgi:hypothetical protein